MIQTVALWYLRCRRSSCPIKVDFDLAHSFWVTEDKARWTGVTEDKAGWTDGRSSQELGNFLHRHAERCTGQLIVVRKLVNSKRVKGGVILPKAGA